MTDSAIDGPRTRGWNGRAMLIATLVVLLPIAYAQSLGGGYLWDDDYYVWANPLLGDVAGLREIWLGILDGPSRYALPQYYPLTHTTFWVEHQLWGDSPLGYRVTNLALHGIVSGLVYAILRHLRLRGAMLAAILFAVHPLHVESVAWITERKNVLSGALGLGAFLCWLRWTAPADGGRQSLPPRAPAVPDAASQSGALQGSTIAADREIDRGDAQSAVPPAVGGRQSLPPRAPEVSDPASRSDALHATAGPASGSDAVRAARIDVSMYVLGATLFALALCSKSIVAALPAALIVVRWWRPGRFDWRRVILGMLPLLALGAAYGLLTAYMEVHRVGAQGPEWDFAPTAFGEAGARTQLAGRAAWFYLSKLFVPWPLMFSYPRVPPVAGDAVGYVAPVSAAIVLIALWALRGRLGRGPAAGAMLFCGLLVPAMGFSNVLPMRYSFVADHFCYLASVPVLAGIAWLVTSAPGPADASVRSAPTIGRMAFTVAIVAACVALTFRHAAAFHDARSLWLDTIAKNPRSWIAINNLGLLDMEAGDVEAARARFEHLLRDVKPDHREAMLNLAELDRRAGDDAAAMARLDALVATHPDYGGAWQLRGSLLERAGDVAGAIAAYERAAGTSDGGAMARVRLARALLMRAGREAGQARADTLDRAADEAEAATGRSPRSAEAWLVRAQVALARGDGATAAEAIGRADRAAPGRADVLTTRATIELAAGDVAAAERSLRSAIAERPDAFEPTFNLAVLLERTGRAEAAGPLFRRAAELRPGDPRLRGR